MEQSKSCLNRAKVALKWAKIKERIAKKKGLNRAKVALKFSTSATNTFTLVEV